jgi:hypothetical protein
MIKSLNGLNTKTGQTTPLPVGHKILIPAALQDIASGMAPSLVSR